MGLSEGELNKQKWVIRADLAPFPKNPMWHPHLLIPVYYND